MPAHRRPIARAGASRRLPLAMAVVLAALALAVGASSATANPVCTDNGARFGGFGFDLNDDGGALGFTFCVTGDFEYRDVNLTIAANAPIAVGAPVPPEVQVTQPDDHTLVFTASRIAQVADPNWPGVYLRLVPADDAFRGPIEFSPSGTYTSFSPAATEPGQTIDLPAETFTFGPRAPARGGSGCPRPSAAFRASWIPGSRTDAFDGALSTPGFPASLATLRWDFGDGSGGSGLTPSHDYALPGEYTVGLTVTNSCGSTGSTTRRVVVDAPRTYAPEVLLHPGEVYPPSAAGDFVRAATLHFRAPRCQPAVDARWAHPDAARLGRQAQRPYRHRQYRLVRRGRGRSVCRPDGRVAANAPIRLAAAAPDRGWPGFFALTTPKGLAGSGSINAPVYSEYEPGRYVIYWFFYPYNGWFHSFRPLGPLPGGASTPGVTIAERHGGDWEHMVVRLGSDDLRSGVAIAQHNCPIARGSTAGLVYTAAPGATSGGATHPVVYAALGGHATYPTAGVQHWRCTPSAFPRPSWLKKSAILDDTGDGGEWRTWEAVADARALPWYGFGGVWGDRGRRHSGEDLCLCVYGPPGPGPDKLAQAVPPGW